MTEETRPTIKTAELGYTFSRNELSLQCVAIFGAVAWPGTNPGFAVVIGMDPYNKMYLLEEYESESIAELVNNCGALDLKFHSCRWFGDGKHDAAAVFINELNRKNRKRFSLNGTSILDMSHPYRLMLDKLKGEYLKTDKKWLVLKEESRVKNYLSSIEPSKITKMELGEYPAIEAVAIAAIELQDEAERIHRRIHTKPKSAYNNNTLTRGLKLLA